MTSSPIYSPFTALALKVVGLIMIVSSLLDYIFLAIPFNPGQRAWQLALTTQLVDRGILPMVGIAFLLVGYWISNSMGAPSARKPLVQDLRFWALLLSSILGLIFLLLVPLHINNVVQQSNEAFKQINQGASQAQSLLEAQTKQVDELVKDPQRLSELEKAINSGQVQGQQLAQLQALRDKLNTFKKDPKALNQEVGAAQERITREKQQKESQARTETLKIGLRTSLSSLFLAIGYIAIGWSGLRSSKG
ncbi:MAG: HpsJ family protein [Cyanobacteriota bacterium]